MNCPKCNKDECIVETDADVTIYFCFGCGYRTRSDFNTKNFSFQSTITLMSIEQKKMAWKDSKSGLYWFPINFDIPTVGILYPQGDVSNIEWVYMPMMELTDKEMRKNPGKKERPDEIRKKIFTETNIKEALKLLKVIE